MTSPLIDALNPRGASTLSISSPEMSTPSRCLQTSVLISTVMSSGSGLPASIAPLQSEPPASSIKSPVSRSADDSSWRGLTPRSNLKEESLEILWRLLELRTVTGLNVAVSMRMFFVSLVTAVSAPPLTPASATGLTASAITRSSDVNLIDVAPSPSGKNSSPSLARRTIIFPPSSLSKSKTCVGCPSSKSTKFVASTTAFRGTSPRFAIFVASHSGDSVTLMS